jgi:hypothetical protein
MNIYPVCRGDFHHPSCALVAEIKKKQYAYYHCTGNKGKCPEKWVREEEIARQFGQAIGAIKMDNECSTG